MTSVAQWSIYRRPVIGALLAAGAWLFLQEGCVPDREVSAGSAMSVVLAVQDDSVLHRHGQTTPISIRKEDRSGSMETPSQSLKHASILLHKAANAIEKDNVLAVQLIRQVVSILKHQVIPSLIDQNSTLLPISSLSGLAEQEIDGEGPMRSMRE